MLDIFDGEEGISRRRLLTIGALGGLSLPTLYAAAASAGPPLPGLHGRYAGATRKRKAAIGHA